MIAAAAGAMSVRDWLVTIALVLVPCGAVLVYVELELWRDRRRGRLLVTRKRGPRRW